MELLDKIAEYTGWKYEYVYDTWDNVLKKLESGEIDMICQAQRTPEREERFLLSKYWAGTEACVLYARMDDDRYYFMFYICSFLLIFRSDHKKPLDILPQSHSGCKQFLLLLFFCKLVQNFI